MASRWEPRKREIEELYIEQKKSLDEVKHIMENQRGFYASKAGYERQLKMWNFRKNERQQHLKLIKARLQVRREQGKVTEVYLRGSLLSKLDIQKKVDRCFISAVEQHKLQTCESPPELVIITPTSESYMVSIRSRELPWFFFLQQLNEFENLGMIIKMPENMLRDCMIPNFCPNSSPLVPTHLQQLINHLSAIIPVDHDDHIIAVLKKIFSGDYSLATIEFLKLAVYVLSNKLLDSQTLKGSLFCDKLLEWFKMGRNYLFVRFILSQNSPTIEAFIENIFASIVYHEDEFFLKILLESGIDPNIKIARPVEASRKVVQPPDCYIYTPLSYFAGTGNVRLAEIIIDKGAAIDLDGHNALTWAAFNGRIEVAELLLRRGAPVNRPYRRGSHSSQLRALERAAMAGHLEMATLLLDNGADINATSGDLGCPLELGINAEANGLVKLLLDRGADVNCSGGKYGLPPLLSAVRKRNYPLVNRLVQLGADVNSQDTGWYGETALQSASRSGSLEICQTLIQAGADVNAAPSKRDGNTALDLAVYSKNSQLVSFLLEHGAHHRRCEKTTLEEAVASNDIKMVQILLAAQEDPRWDKSFISAIERKNFEIIRTFVKADSSIFPDLEREALCAAVATGDVEVVRLLLDLGACPNDRVRVRDDYYPLRTPLVDAVMLGNVPIIEALLDGGADCNRISESYHYLSSYICFSLNALQTACQYGRIELVRYLLDRGADLNRPAAEVRGHTALQAAVDFGDVELVRFLISKEANVNAPPARDEEGWTALQAAIQKERIDLVQMLLEAGAHPNDTISHIFGRYSLQLAAANGDKALVQLLLDHGADVNWPTTESYGCTALYAASEHGHYNIVELLLAEGANANAGAALQAAAEGAYMRIAKMLLDAGACVNARGGGYTALEKAARYGRIDMLKLLLNAGADISSEEGRHELHCAMYWAVKNGHNAAAKFLKYHQIS